jgi:hypothetical protein
MNGIVLGLIIAAILTINWVLPYFYYKIRQTSAVG